MKTKKNLREKEEIINCYKEGNLGDKKKSQDEVAKEFGITKNDVKDILHEANIYNKAEHTKSFTLISGKEKMINPILKED